MSTCATSAPALLVTPEGDVTEVALPATSHERLALMYSALDCSAVQRVCLTDGLIMWVDEDGFANRHINWIATGLAQRFGQMRHYIYGPVLLTGGADGQGGTLPLTRAKVGALLSAFQDTFS